MNAEDKLRKIHEAVDKFNQSNKEEMLKQKRITPADNLFAELVQGPYVHALVDARLKHNMELAEVEEAICALTANMMCLLLRSVLPPILGPVAIAGALRMCGKMDDYLHNSITTYFTNTGEEPTDADSIH